HCHSAKHVRSLNSSTFADKSLVQGRSSSCGTFALIRHFKLFHEAILATTFFSKPCEVGCTSATDLHLRSPAATFAALRLRLCCEHCNLLVLHVLISTTQPSRFNTTPYEHWIWSPPLRQCILISKLSLASSSPCSLASTTLVECTLGDSAGMTGNRSTGISDLSNLLLFSTVKSWEHLGSPASTSLSIVTLCMPNILVFYYKKQSRTRVWL
ncbi:hypothetical protein P692DRAFT_20900518, partial [Suillus brevipes Sb2]